MDTQYLYIDFVVLIPLSLMQAWTESYHTLTKDVPTSTLFYFPVLLSVTVTALIQAAFQIFFFFNIRKQPFYVPLDPADISWELAIPSYEETVLFMICNLQYLTTCIAFSIAEPFRKPIWTNYPFFFCVCCAIALDVFIIFAPDNSFMARWFDLLPFSTKDETSYYSYRYMVAIGAVCNSLVTYGAEKLILHKLTRICD